MPIACLSGAPDLYLAKQSTAFSSFPPPMLILRNSLATALAALRRRRLLLAVLSGALLSLAFPGHPHPLMSWFYHPLWAHIALVPLLLALSGRGFKEGFAAGWTCGFVWNLLSLYWVAHTQGGGPAVDPAADQCGDQPDISIANKRGCGVHCGARRYGVACAARFDIYNTGPCTAR